MSSATATSGGPAATADAGTGAPTRGRRAAAVLFDVLTGALAIAVAALVATLWLLARTGWGREPIAGTDSLVATALVLSAGPAWAAWQIARVRRGAGTAGQARLALAVRPRDGAGRPAALRRLAFHPLAAAAWLWLATLALLLDALPIALAGALATAAWTLAGMVSAALILRDPTARALHDRLAGTRLVRR